MLSTAAALILCFAPPLAASKADIAAVKGVYPAFIRAFDDKNWERAGRMLAADYVHESPSQVKTNKAEFLKAEAAALAPLKHIKFVVSKYSDFQTTQAGTSLELSWEMTATLVDKQGKHKVKAEGTESHLWKKTNGKWLLEAIREHHNTFAMDGKIVQEEPAKK